ncbi:hypothetical protein SHKM778_78650 [Streptomyces sp. KM77-8]|uniref:Uncharacterized protein n=1 Tax=Streptomyces haneummycinicus TaxID=3074435 RepID=A0AAT9HW68_9ACTN
MCRIVRPRWWTFRKRPAGPGGLLNFVARTHPPDHRVGPRVKEAVVRRVRPGTTASRGAGSRAAGEERALSSVTAGDRCQGGGEPRDLPRLWHVTLSVSGPPAPSRRCGGRWSSSPTTTRSC